MREGAIQVVALFIAAGSGGAWGSRGSGVAQKMTGLVL